MLSLISPPPANHQRLANCVVVYKYLHHIARNVCIKGQIQQVHVRIDCDALICSAPHACAYCVDHCSTRAAPNILWYHSQSSSALAGFDPWCRHFGRCDDVLLIYGR